VIEQAESAQIGTDGLTIDLLSRHAWREDRKVELSSREFALLEYFMRHSGQVLSAIWDYDFEPASNVVDVYVRHLRNKVDPPDGPSLIQTTSAAPVTVSILRQPPGLTARLPEDFKMKFFSSQVHRGFMHGVYNPGMSTAGGDLHAGHRVTAAGGRPSWGPGSGDSSFPYFSHRIFAPRTPICGISSTAAFTSSELGGVGWPSHMAADLSRFFLKPVARFADGLRPLCKAL
jgi:hypothetical protein